MRLIKPIAPARALVPAVVVCLAAGGLAACGGSGEKAASQRGDPEKLRAAGLKFARCMREQGVDVPDPQPGRGVVIAGPSSGSAAAARRAEERCGKHLDAVPPPRLSDEQKSDMRQRALAHARCMRAHGVDFPDPTFDENGGAQVKIGEGFDPTDPRVRRAESQCAKQGGGPVGGPAARP